LIPNLIANSEPEEPLTKYGLMRRNFLKEHRRGTYSGMMLEGNLKEHCLMIQKQAEERMDRLTSQMAKSQGVNEALKASDQMKWVGLMNNIRASAEEIVLSELIYS
ncbi:MAG: TnpV protein, partial [Acidaminococcaceae bacterium]|nr:TnpV protein [Acidaminococcaceae bacterium]